jgi:hypothetical protein
VLPVPELIATKSNSEFIPVLQKTCPLNMSVLQETVLQKSTPNAELDVSK